MSRGIGNHIYLDYAASSPLCDEVVSAMEPYLGEHFANPSALYRMADETKKALTQAREDIAELLGVQPREVIFTSGATEANNLAIQGFSRAHKKGRVVTTPIEHPSLYEPVQMLKREGYETATLPVDKGGFVKLEEVENLQPRGLPAQAGRASQLITLAHANPDIGTVQNIPALRKAVGKSAIVHVDAAQSPSLLPVKEVVALADMVTLSGSKIYGPPGTGVLVVKERTAIAPLMYGGGQEGGMRPGTPYVAGAVGLATALQLAVKEQMKEAERLSLLRNRIFTHVLDALEEVAITGPGLKTLAESNEPVRLPNHASFAFKDIEGDELVVRLDKKGFAVGTGTACASGKEGVSRAVQATGVTAAYRRGTLRVTLGKQTTAEHIDAFVEALVDVVEEMRSFNT